MRLKTFVRPVACLGLLAMLFVCDSPARLTAQPKPGPIAVLPQAPTINVPFPLGATRGQAYELTLTGTNLTDPVALFAGFPVKATFPVDANNGKEPGKLRVKLEIPNDAPIGVHAIRIATRSGISNSRVFCVDDVPTIEETADNKSKEKAQTIPLPVTVAGRVENETSDFFKFAVTAGQRLTFDALARRIGSPLDPMIRIIEAKSGRDLPGLYSDDEPGLQSDARLTYVFPTAGEYLVEIRDTRHLGGADSVYRLRIADCPAALTAWPCAVKKGAKASVTFTGKSVDQVAAVDVVMPADREVVNVVPKAKAASGWPVPVLASDVDEIVETEPNNEPAKAQKLTLPVGVTGRFLEKGDIDCFAFAGKKGTKYNIVAETYEINSIAEVYLVIKDSKGAEVAKSNPQNTPARVDFTPGADGDFTIVAEHLNFQHGPLEVYHLTVKAAEPTFEVALQLDRVCVAPGQTAVLPVALVTRADYAGPVELKVVGHPGLSGSVVIPNAAAPQPGQAAGFLPVTAKADLPAGAYPIRVEVKANINGKDVVRLANISDLVKQSLNGLVNPQREFLTDIGLGVTGPETFSLSMKVGDAVRGIPSNVVVTAKRAAGFTDEITLAAVGLPPNVAVAAKPIAKGTNEITFPLTPAANAALGSFPLILRGAAKPGGKDVASYATPTPVAVVLPVEVKAEPLTLKPGEKAKLKVSIVRKVDYKGPVDVEVKNLPANVTTAKVTLAPDKSAAEIEIHAMPNAPVGDKADVQVVATATGAANQQGTATVLVKIVK
jgi:hypothetical protein